MRKAQLILNLAWIGAVLVIWEVFYFLEGKTSGAVQVIITVVVTITLASAIRLLQRGRDDGSP